MATEVDDLVHSVERTRTALLESVANLRDDQGAFKPSAHEWSIAMSDICSETWAHSWKVTVSMKSCFRTSCRGRRTLVSDWQPVARIVAPRTVSVYVTCGNYVNSAPPQVLPGQ